MKKSVFILGLILLSGSCVFAHFHESYTWYYAPSYRPMPHMKHHRIHRPVHRHVYYPTTGVSLNINNYNSMSPVARSIYYSTRGRKNGVSVYVSI